MGEPELHRLCFHFHSRVAWECWGHILDYIRSFYMWMHRVYFANSYIGCSKAVHGITMIDHGVELSSVLGAFRSYCHWVFSKIFPFMVGLTFWIWMDMRQALESFLNINSEQVWMNRWSYGNVWMPGSPLWCSHWKLLHSYDMVGNIFLQEFNIGLTGYIQLSFFWNVMNSGLSTNWDTYCQ
jgi:hypothetical protein